MSKSKLFPTSVVGSLPRPQAVRELFAEDASYSAAEREERLDSAVREAVALQERAGLDVINDGEWRRRSYIGVIADLAHGFEVRTRPDDGRPWTVVVDRLAPKQPGFVAREVSFVRGLTQREVKATLPAPALLGERLWDPERSASAYPTREAFVEACVPFLREEARRLAAAGADIVQIDDPHLCLFVDPTVRSGYDDPDAAADFSADMVNAVVDGLSGVKRALHLCRRAGARVRGEASFSGGYAPILSQLNRINVHHLTMEFTAPAAGDLSVLSQLRSELEVGLGCVDVTPGRIDSPETIMKRVRSALEHVDPERVTLNPDCGFAPGSGAVVSLDEVYEKLCNEVEAARTLREQV